MSWPSHPSLTTRGVASPMAELSNPGEVVETCMTKLGRGPCVDAAGDVVFQPARHVIGQWLFFTTTDIWTDPCLFPCSIWEAAFRVDPGPRAPSDHPWLGCRCGGQKGEECLGLLTEREATRGSPCTPNPYSPPFLERDFFFAKWRPTQPCH